MAETLRTFIASELPESVLSLLAAIQQELQSFRIRAKWIAPQNIHLTLKFLGNIDAGAINKIAGLMSDSVQGLAPILLTAKGVGVFPGIKRPRVIWVGLAGQTPALVAMQRKLEDNLAAIGFPQENKVFRGHLTLGRLKEGVNPNIINKIIETYAARQSEEFSVDRIVLFKSDLTPTGSIYSKLQTVAFEAV